MSIYDSPPHTIAISRLGADAGIRTTWSSVATNVPVFIQPMQAEFAVQLKIARMRAFRMWLYNVSQDIQIKDRVVDQDGKTYEVRGIEKHNYGEHPHLDIFLEQEIADR